MSHRPYPRVDRARHQLDRHDDEMPPMFEPRPMTPIEQRLARNAQAILNAAQPTVALAAARLYAALRPCPASSEEKTA
ncbi:hypothetical protein [Streptomyces misionensis]|uniref:hypothetical protein n=1 Tax=Streptomyces misionensis TaxID=67331 RepID=UPI0036B52321